MRRYFVFMLCTAVALFMIRCESNVAGGGTIETTNGIMGALYNGDKSPAAEVVVKLYTEEYDPLGDRESLPPVVDTTDKNGTFMFEDVAPGGYSVFALDDNTAKGFYAGNIGIEKDTMTTIADGILETTGAVVTDFSASEVIMDNDYVYLPGTGIYSYIGDAGTALLNNVPVGSFSELILATSDGAKRNILNEVISVTSKDTVSIVNPQWEYHMDIILNTTPSGADIADDVPDFPVLIRLDKDNFDFEQAMPDGGDLLFTGDGDMLLSHEIEQWDADAQRAAIWVKIDTVFGNNDTQSIRMYWGNTDASSLSNSSIVFDTSNGYQGVWHLADNENAGDATYNGFEGSSSEGSIPQPAEGIIGGCLSFDGTDDYLTMENTADGKLNFEESGYFTISAWVSLNNVKDSSYCILSKGYEQYYLRSTYISKELTMDTPLWEFVEFSETDKWNTSTSPSIKGDWTLLVGVRQGDKQMLFCNGELVDSTIDTWRNAVSRNTANDLFIGRFAEQVDVPFIQGYCPFSGLIDEVRILSKSQSPDWVRLCYMNQRPDDRLVLFK